MYHSTRQKLSEEPPQLPHNIDLDTVSDHEDIVNVKQSLSNRI